MSHLSMSYTLKKSVLLESRIGKMPETILSTIELFGLDKLFSTQGGWITICHAAHLTGDQSILIENIRFAIPNLLKRHPRMRSRLRTDGHRSSLEILDYDEEYFRPELFYSIVKSKDQTWQEIADRRCHTNPYSDNAKPVFPLFHFIIQPNEQNQSNSENPFHILLFSHHCGSDGRSGFIVINDLLTLVTSSDLKQRTEPVNKEIIPCVGELIPRPFSVLYPLLFVIGKYLFKKDLRALVHPQIPVKIQHIEGLSTPFQVQPAKYNMLFASTSTNLCERLRAKCKSQNLTLHGPLHACIVLAIHHCFQKTNRYLKPLDIDIDFNMRERLPESSLTNSTVGHFVGIGTVKLNSKFPLNSTLFWRLAKKCSVTTNKNLSSGELAITSHFLKDALENERLQNELLSHCPDGRASEFNFSNIGKYPFSCDYNQLRLRGLHVVNNAAIIHTSTLLFVTCAGDGQFDISLAHEIADSDKAKEFLDYYIRLLETCADANIDITLRQLLTNAEEN